MSEQQSTLETAYHWLEQGRGVAIATVVSTWGSSPRPVGSQLVVNDKQDFEGSVSGGCVETAVIQEAMEVIDKESWKMLSFGVSNAQAWEVGLACGGKIQVLLEPLVAD